MKIQQALSHAKSRLIQSESPLLDAELLLAHVLVKSREFLITWPETDLTETEQQAFINLLEQRIIGHPIAHLIGSRAFWNFNLEVSPDVLIPRPETELLVEIILERLDENNLLLADLGTGSGAIALAIASERENWQIVATDLSEAALSIAKQNAKNLKLSNIEFRHGSWTEALEGKKSNEQNKKQNNELFDAIISNPPYIDKTDKHLSQGDVRFEPMQALVAEEKGLADLKQITTNAQKNLKPGAILLLEHGYQQGEVVRQLLEQSGYKEIQTYNDLAGLERVSIGRK
ncbi:MAG: peptide chain release factor N(5)-glutamine methyltransferase [Gammaproteobacteria bacterium]|nr:peptide chain release factor N(5)-glutamine methyltransferase [Gammaproteobacteria bacterium]